MKKGDERLDLEKLREKKLGEEELKRMIRVAEWEARAAQAAQILIEQRGDSETLENAICHLRALYELQELREEKRKKGEKGEKGKKG